MREKSKIILLASALVLLVIAAIFIGLKCSDKAITGTFATANEPNPDAVYLSFFDDNRFLVSRQLSEKTYGSYEIYKKDGFSLIHCMMEDGTSMLLMYNHKDRVWTVSESPFEIIEYERLTDIPTILN